MAGVFGANLMSYLRLLSPTELDKLVLTSEKREKVKLTSLVSADVIADFSNAKTTTDFSNSKLERPACSDLEDIEEDEEDENPYKHKVEVSEESEEDPDDKPKVRMREPTAAKYRFDHDLEEKQSLSAFMLDQKKQMKTSQTKLKQKEVLELYEDTNRVEVASKHADLDDDEDEEKEANLNFYSGLLIDKKTG